MLALFFWVVIGVLGLWALADLALNGTNLPTRYIERMPSDATEITRHAQAQLRKALILITRVVEAGALIPESEASARAFLGQTGTTQLTPAQSLVTVRDLLVRVEAQDEVQVALPSELIKEITDWLADFRKES